MRVMACLGVVVAVLAGEADARSPDPILERAWWQTTDLREHIGQTYLQTFLADVVGIHAEIVADYNRPIVIADADTVVAVLDKFDPKVSKKIFEDYFDGQEAFVSVVEQIAGRRMQTADLRDTLKARVDQAVLARWASQELSETADMVLLASGSGTLVRLDDRNYFYNVAFQDPIRYSGRSYRVSHGDALDPSDAVYLNEIDAYLGPDNTDPSPLYQVMFELLTNSDPRGIADLPSDTQRLIADFMTIYTAELDRNNMAELSPDTWPWQSDLAELTLIAAYGGASGMAMKDGELIRCSTFAYTWTHGMKDRSELMRVGSFITEYERSKNPQLVYDVIALTPLTDREVVASVGTDLFRRVLIFLNRPETMETAQANAVALTSAMVALLKQVRSDQASITDFIKAETKSSGDKVCDNHSN
jgi:hypothetical protein